jgi:hypothetical protein
LSGALSALVVLGVLGTFALAYFQRNDVVPVLVATRDVSAFRVLGPGDVKAGTHSVDRNDHAGFLTELPASRVTLHGLHAGEPIRRHDLGPALEVSSRVIGVETTRAAVLAGAVRPGDAVELAVAPERGEGVSLSATVLAVTPDPGAKTYSLVVAIPQRVDVEDLQAFERSVAREVTQALLSAWAETRPRAGLGVAKEAVKTGIGFVPLVGAAISATASVAEIATDVRAHDRTWLSALWNLASSERHVA